MGIEEVASSYIKLERAGANLKARCPFHNEKTPSFFISPDRGTYYCFGCGASGDIFTFVQEFEGLDFKGTLKMLAARAGVELPRYKKEDKESRSEKEKLYAAMEEAAKFFEANLTPEIIAYLKGRGLQDETIKSFRIGFARDEWRSLYDHMLGRGFTEMELEKAGLIKRNEGKVYDRFRSRAMFPLSDSSGRIVAFSGRIWGEGEPKYLNSPETPIFSKHSVLYGIDRAKDSIRKNNFSILVEGQFDLILSHQAGYRNTVASSGTALSDAVVSKENVVSNLGLVRRLSQNLVLAFDSDKAGFNATLRAGSIALSLGMDVKVAELPEGVDPADLIGKSGSDAWREAIKNSKHIIEFVLEKILKDTQGDLRKAGREARQKVLPYVAALASSIEKAHFLKKISDRAGIPLSALEEDFRKVEDELSLEQKQITATEESLQRLGRRDYIERRLLGIAFWQETLTAPAIDSQEIFERIGKRDNYENSKEDLIFEAEVFYGSASEIKKDVAEMLSRLEEENVNEELGRAMHELHNLKDKERERELVQKINELSKKKEEIKNGRLKN